MEIIPGPDFPTGGLIMGSKGIKEAFETGKGRITVRAKAEILDDRTCQQIVITEIPYEVIKSQLVKKMDEIRLSKDIDGILDVRDESDRTGMRIVVDVKKESDANMILNYFYKNTDLQIYYSYNNVAIIDKRPVQVGLLDLLDAFLAFRKEVVLRRSKYELDKMEARCHIIEGLMKAVSILDEVIRVYPCIQGQGRLQGQSDQGIRHLMNRRQKQLYPCACIVYPIRISRS
jgi:topoisomerase-4 subunit A